MRKKVNAAIIGCGVISDFHARGIQANSEQVDFYAVCDIIEERAQKLAAQYGVKRYFTDYKEMLSDENIDLVCICTPSGMHAEMAIDCAKAGKHVLCEKPLDVTREKLDGMIEAFDHTGMKLGCVFQYRTYAGIRRAKEILNSGELGKILIANGYCKIYRSPEYYKSAGWRGTWEMDGGGCLMNQAVHTLDILCYLAGDVESTRAKVFTLARDIEVEDTAFAFLEFKNQAYGVFEAATIYSPGIGAKVEIQCEHGRIEFNAPFTTLYRTLENGKAAPKSLDDEKAVTDGAASNPAALDYEGHRYLVADMAQAILNDKQPYVRAEAGRHAVDVILSIYKASRENKEIMIRS
jgi:UDP-N-acetyl-2-amino-2-deoxyglucuronate dehydrogenase